MRVCTALKKLCCPECVIRAPALKYKKMLLFTPENWTCSQRQKPYTTERKVPERAIWGYLASKNINWIGARRSTHNGETLHVANTTSLRASCTLTNTNQIFKDLWWWSRADDSKSPTYFQTELFEEKRLRKRRSNPMCGGPSKCWTTAEHENLM